MVVSNAPAYEGLWMDLIDALNHIQLTEKCTSLSAQIQLKQRIGRGEVSAKWADSEGPNDVPNNHVLARSQFVLSGPGLAPGTNSLRPLLVLRTAVLSAWPRAGHQGTKEPDSVGIRRRDLSKRNEWEERDDDYDRWMSLVEAVEHIRTARDCASVEALRELKTEIGDGMIQVGWAHSNGPDDSSDAKCLSTSQLLLIGPGVAPHNEVYRALLIDRSSVQRLWSLTSDPFEKAADSLDDLTRSSVSQIPASRVSKPSDEDIRSAFRQIYETQYQSGAKPPNLTEAWKLLQSDLPGARRKRAREILHETEFATKRLPPGR
jgi:hypothetical protein